MPASDTWKYIENQMDSATRHSRPALDKVVQFFNAAIATAAAEPGADPVFNTILVAFATPKENWDIEYSEWTNASAGRESSTVSWETLLSNLAIRPALEEVSKIEDWDSRIRVEAPHGSARYVKMLPDGRAPFSEGSYAEILKEVKDLGTRLTEEIAKPNLVALGTEVTAYYTQMKEARDKQIGAESTEEQESEDITPVRTTIVQELYGALGLLMHHFRTNPESIAAFFDLETLRRPAKKKTTT